MISFFSDTMPVFIINNTTMAQTTVQNEKSIRLGSCICRVNGVNIGALQNAKFVVEVATSQLKADNAELDPRKKVTSAKVTCDAWEINIDNLAKFDGIGTVSSTPASPKTVTGEKLLDGGQRLKKGTSLILAGAQHDGSVATAITLKNGSATIPSSDYAVGLTTDGKTQIVYTGNEINAVNAAGLKVDYTYTPAARKTYVVKDVIKLIETFPVELENTDADGKKFIIELPKAYNTKGVDFDFQSDDKLDEVMKYPLEFMAQPIPNKDLYYIHDEQAV